LSVGLSLALLGDNQTLASPHILNNHVATKLVRESISNQNITSDLAMRDGNSTPLEERSLLDFILFAVDVAEIFLPVQAGLLKFIGNSINLGVQCLGYAAGITKGLDCIFAAADIAFQGYSITAAVAAEHNGINKRDGSNSTVPAYIPPHLEFHIGHPHSPEFAHTIRNGLNDTVWIHMATSTKHHPVVHTIHVKHADKSVLGPEPRSEPVFHVRATEQLHMTSTSKRNEGTKNGLVFDYLWDQGVPAEKELKGGSVVREGDILGSEIAHWMEVHSSEANCASLAILQAQGPGEGTNLPRIALNRGLAAFGWNNAPFNFNGRAGGWISQCAI
jgi:hypothetical protein